MALSVAELRRRTAAQVEALTGYTESRWCAELLGQDTSSLAHHAFAVATPSTEIATASRLTKTGGEQVWRTSVTVAFLHRVRADAQVADTDAATDEEQAVLRAVLAASRADYAPRLVRITRESLGDGTWRLARLDFEILHPFTI